MEGVDTAEVDVDTMTAAEWIFTEEGHDWLDEAEFTGLGIHNPALYNFKECDFDNETDDPETWVWATPMIWAPHDARLPPWWRRHRRATAKMRAANAAAYTRRHWGDVTPCRDDVERPPERV